MQGARRGPWWAPNVVGHPVFAEQVLGDFDHDVVGIDVRVVVETIESLQA